MSSRYILEYMAMEPNQEVSVAQLADELDRSCGQVASALTRLRNRGLVYRFVDTFNIDVGRPTYFYRVTEDGIIVSGV